MWMQILGVSVLALMLQDVTRAEVCTTTTYITTYSQRSSKYKCGWFGWSRCTRYHTKSTNTAVDVDECCDGAYGYVATGCVGVCPYDSPQISNTCGGAICRNFMCDQGGFRKGYPTLNIHENDFAAKKIFTAEAMCFVQFTCPDCSCDCDRSRRSIHDDVSDRNRREASCLCSKNEPCTTCSVSNTDLFEVRNGLDIWKRECVTSDRTSGPACLDADVAYDKAEVTCTGSGNDDNDAVTLPLSFIVEREDEPEFEIDVPNPSVSGGMAVGDVVLQLDSVDLDLSTGGKVVYTIAGVQSPTTERDLFYFDADDLSLKVKVDLSMEPSHEYQVNMCVNTRRHSVCKTITITLDSIMTTTTTTPTTTTEPAPESYCRAAGAWKTLWGMDSWCQMVCTHSQPYCPESHCTCADELEPGERGRSICKPTPDYVMINGMDNWCDWNCNTEYPISCLPTHCTCDPPVDYNVVAPWQNQ